MESDLNNGLIIASIIIVAFTNIVLFAMLRMDVVMKFDRVIDSICDLEKQIKHNDVDFSLRCGKGVSLETRNNNFTWEVKKTYYEPEDDTVNDS